MHKNKDTDQLRSKCTPDKCPCFCYIDSKIPPYLNQKFQASSYLVVVQLDLCRILSETPNIMKTCPCNVNPLTPRFYKVKLRFTRVIVFSSPEPLGSQGELIVYPSSRRPSVRCPSVRPPFSKIFSSETARPIKTKFYVEPPWGWGTKIYINGPGHMTK